MIPKNIKRIDANDNTPAPADPMMISKDMLVIVYFCKKDAHLAEKNLDWCIRMEQKVDFDALLAFDRETPPDAFERVMKLAKRYFRNVEKFLHDPPKFKTWPQAPNHAWQCVAREMSMKYRRPWFWWEADTTPLRPGWIKAIWEEYQKGGKPFMGCLIRGVCPSGHINGVAVYPPRVGKYHRDVMLLPANAATAWDVYMGAEIVGRGRAHFMNDLYQHCWNLTPERQATNGDGTEPSFANWGEVEGFVDFRKVIFHRCKDGSLIDRIIERNGSEPPPEPWENTADHTQGGNIQMGMSNGKVVIDLIGGKKIEVDPGPKPRVEFLIVTHAKDIPWLRYCLKSVRKWASGFDNLTVAAPRHQEQEFQDVRKESDYRLILYDEVPGHGMMQHEEVICRADQVCPGADFVVHIDSDCCFKEPVHWWDYVLNGKAVNVCRTYKSMCGSEWNDAQRKGYHGLTAAQRKVVSDCYQWRAVVAKALGFEPDIYTMCRHPSCYPKWLYPKVRAHIEAHTKKPFHTFMMEQKNEFPQTFAEFPTLGGYAWRFHRDEMHWFDISDTGPDGAPRDRLRAYWSHGGLDQAMPSGKTAREELEDFTR